MELRTHSESENSSASFSISCLECAIGMDLTLLFFLLSAWDEAREQMSSECPNSRHREHCLSGHSLCECMGLRHM